MSHLSFRTGLKAGVPIGLGYLSVSFAFGMMARSGGLPLGITVLISMTNLTSAGQLAGLGILLSSASVTEMILAQFIINLRYSLMSLSLSQKLDQTVRLADRFLLSFGITDEIFAVASSNERVGRRYLFGLIVIPYIGWTLGTLLGGIAGDILPTTVTSALGIAMYAMFLAIIIPPSKRFAPVLKVCSLSILISCAMHYLPFFHALSDGFIIIICAVIAAGFGAVLFPVREVTHND